MKKRLLEKIIVIILITLFITMIMPKSLMAVSPGKFTGAAPDDTSISLDFTKKIANIIRFFGIFIAVGAMMIIGIKYITGSIEEKASYKKSMMPYLIGCVILFGASTISGGIFDIFKNNTDVEDIGNIVLGIIRVLGTAIAVGVLMILGIKYMIGSVEERASYKKSMMPYLIGSVLLFASVNLTSAIYDNFALDDELYVKIVSPSTGKSAAKEYIQGHTYEDIYNEYLRAVDEKSKLESSGTASDDQIAGWTAYINELYEVTRFTYQ